MASYQEVLKSELDLFKPVSYQESISNSLLIEYRPTTALSESSTIEFDIPVSDDEYLDLQNIYLHYKGKLVKQDGSAYSSAGEQDCSLVNYGINTIFDQMTIYLGGTMVSQSSNTYHYMAFIEALTQYDELQSKLMNSAGYVHYVATDLTN